MSHGDCRRLLTFGIPAVAVLVGFLWLRRCRRKRRGSERAAQPEPVAKKTISEETVQVCVSEIINSEEEVEVFERGCVFEVPKLASQQFESPPNLVEEVVCVDKETTDLLELTIQRDNSQPMTTSTKDSTEMSSKIETIQPSSQNVPKTSDSPKMDKPVAKISPTKTENLLKKNKKPDDIPVKSNKSKKGKKSNRTSDKENEKQTEDAKSSVNLVDKLSSLKLDDMKLRERETSINVGSERDSANHSPSDVMLGSPSISNFSDAHSEGSSDSGKGHSDVAISPSRTPAGGSSLAGDVAALSIYEFILPQILVGRLIGRHGAYLNEIKSTTQANIFIKRHPETPKLKICAIEGTQTDIKKALQKIRQKFPLKKHPQLTLEKVSFISLNSPIVENLRLSLIEGINNDVLLSSLISAAHFFLQQPSHPTYPMLATLNYAMNQAYSTLESPTLSGPIKDAVCAAPTMNGWYRAQIIDVEEDNKSCVVRFLDYGGYVVMDWLMLRQIRGDFLTLPFQAVECCLANVAPVDDNGWSEEARLLIQSLTHGQLLQAQIYDYAEDGTPLVYLYSSRDSEVVLINEELVNQGFAQLVLPAEG